MTVEMLYTEGCPHAAAYLPHLQQLVADAAFMAAHELADVIADAGTICAPYQRAVEDARLSFILGMKIPDIPTSRPPPASCHPMG